MASWQRFVTNFAHSEDYIYEWLNDLDTRRLIDEHFGKLSAKKRTKIEDKLKPLDEEFIAKTFEIKECVWGSKVEKEHEYNRQKHWYYYRMNQKVFDSEKGNFTKRETP